jgi:hypothetical protein
MEQHSKKDSWLIMVVSMTHTVTASSHSTDKHLHNSAAQHDNNRQQNHRYFGIKPSLAK